MHETIECAHDLCSCTLTAEIETEQYCSQTCRESEENGMEADACDCGHPQCDVP